MSVEDMKNCRKNNIYLLVYPHDMQSNMFEDDIKMQMCVNRT